MTTVSEGHARVVPEFSVPGNVKEALKDAAASQRREVVPHELPELLQ